jgi:glutaredoxin
MIRELGKKLSSIIILLLFVLVVYREFLGPKINSDGTAAGSAITLEQSRNMYVQLGGQFPDIPVTVFVTDWCSICKSLESNLTEGGIKYVRADIEKSRDALLYYQMITRRQSTGVPVTVIGDKIFYGYNIRGIAKALIAYGPPPTGSV